MSYPSPSGRAVAPADVGVVGGNRESGEGGEEPALREAWQHAMKCFGDGFPGSDEARMGMALLAKVMGLVRSLALFSSNETVADIPTPHLKYLLAPFFVALLSQRVPPPSSGQEGGEEMTPQQRTEGRLQLLQRARLQLLQFLRNMEALSFLNPSDQAAVEALVDAATEQAVRGGAPQSAAAPKTREDAMREREALMARMQRLNKAKEGLKLLEERRARLRQGAGQEGEAEDEEFEREHTLLLLQAHTLDAISELKSLVQEIDMLRQVSAMGLLSRPSPSAAPFRGPLQRQSNTGPSGAQEPKIFHISEPGAEPEALQRLAQKPTPALQQQRVVRSRPVEAASMASSSSSLQQPALGASRRGFMTAEEAAAAVEHASHTPGGGIAPGHVHHQYIGKVASGLQERIDTRQLIKDAVFLPGWRLPTLMVEEAAEIEMGFAAKGPGGAASHSQEGEEGEDDEAFKANDDASLRKQRDWDDWVDYNPTGIGNRKRMG